MKQESFSITYQEPIRERARLYRNPTAETAIRQAGSTRIKKEKKVKPVSEVDIDALIAHALSQNGTEGKSEPEEKLTRETAEPMWRNAQAIAQEIEKATYMLATNGNTTDVPPHLLPLENPDTISILSLLSRVQERQDMFTKIDQGLRAGKFLATLDEVTPNNPAAWNQYQKARGDVIAPKKWLKEERHVPELQLFRGKMRAAVNTIQR